MGKRIDGKMYEISDNIRDNSLLLIDKSKYHPSSCFVFKHKCVIGDLW